MTGFYEDDPPKEKEYRVKYNSNNSGGNWWLKDEDWKKLEEAGWKVYWAKDEGKSERWLGALATQAEKEFDTMKEAILEFEKVTGQCATDQGCNCCGEPHDFSYIKKDGSHDYYDGTSVLNEFADSKEELLARLLRSRLS